MKDELQVLFSPKYHEETIPGETLPELELIRNVIYRGILDLYSRERNIQRDAHAWIFSNDTKLEFNFLFCCEALNIDPNKLREKTSLTKRETLYRYRL